MRTVEFYGPMYNRRYDVYCSNCFRGIGLSAYCRYCGDEAEGISPIGMKAEEINVRLDRRRKKNLGTYLKRTDFGEGRVCEMCYNDLSRYNPEDVCNACLEDIRNDIVNKL